MAGVFRREPRFDARRRRLVPLPTKPAGGGGPVNKSDSDSATLTERVSILVRTLNQGDAAALAESGASLTRRGGALDAAALADRSASLARSLFDLATLSERVAALARALNQGDAAALAERGASLTRRGGVVDAAALTDRSGLSRGTYDTATEGERGAGMARTVNDSALLSESVSVIKGGAVQKFDSDAFAFSERGASLARVVRGESGVLGDGGAALARTVSDKGTLTDSATVLRFVFKSGTDSAALAERPAGMNRVCTDAAACGERTKSMVRTLNDLFTLADAITVATNFFGNKLGQSFASDTIAIHYAVASDVRVVTTNPDDRSAVSVGSAADRPATTTAADDRFPSTVSASDRA